MIDDSHSDPPHEGEDTAPKVRDTNLSALRQCSACGALGYPPDRFCAACGAGFLVEPVRTTRICSGCGAETRHPVAFFCTRCGADLPQP